MSRKSVAMIVETSNSYSRGVIEGIIRFSREHGRWSLYLPEQRCGELVPFWLAGWKGDGIIARIENSAIARAVRAKRVPVVDVSAARKLVSIPWVETDDNAIARLAFEHLYECGLRTFGFCSEPWYNWSRWRCSAFETFAKNAGCALHFYEVSKLGPTVSWKQERQRLRSWLRSLPKPIGVMACYDQLGQRVLEACRDISIRVPEEIAVVGVDDDPLVCELSYPSLTSVRPNAEGAGYRAAEILDRMMRRIQVPGEGSFLQPLGISLRMSTDVVATPDELVAEGVRHIRQHYATRLDASSVARALAVSRRALDLKFEKVLGRTVHAEIHRVRLQAAKSLLLQSNLPLSVVAERCGYSGESYLIVSFRDATGLTPGEFRGLGGLPSEAS